MLKEEEGFSELFSDHKNPEILFSALPAGVGTRTCRCALWDALALP